MTREEALNILHNASVYHPNYLDALNMAIKALEQEPCEDAVSRQAVLDINFNRIIHTTAKPAEMVRQKVEQLSSVTPHPKTGHWIYEFEDWNKWTCSECGWSKRTDVHIKLGYNYCPNCGTRMVELQSLKYADNDTMMPAT
jgi:rubrerythrin